MHPYYVYILTNVKRNVIYVGVTNDLGRRVIAPVRVELSRGSIA